jgi:uncharacterized protein (TIGR02466 family)
MINYYFPTAILAETHLILANKMLPVAKKYLEDPVYASTNWGYKTTYGYKDNGGLAYLPDVVDFTNFVETVGRKYLLELGYDANQIKFNTLVFASEIADGQHHERHTHPNSILSGLLYLQVPKGSAPLVINDPRPFRDFVYMPKIGDTATNLSEIKFQPTKGLLLIWESWIPHLVPTSHNSEGRITLVFNICREVV